MLRTSTLCACWKHASTNPISAGTKYTKSLKRSKVQRILKSPSANLVRLNQQSSHLASRSTPKGAWKGQTACDMCCRVCSTNDGELIANVAPHKRKGFPGFVSCSICNVVLCTKPRMQHRGLTDTCFELYHTRTTNT